MKRPVILPEAPLPLTVPDSPHWPIGRSRMARDASAAWLRDRAKHQKRPARFRRLVERIQFGPDPAALARAVNILRLREDWRGYAELRRLALLSRWVRQLESPPPQNLALAA